MSPLFTGNVRMSAPHNREREVRRFRETVVVALT